MQVTTHLKLAFFQTGEFPGIEKSSMSVYLIYLGMHCTYLHNKQSTLYNVILRIAMNLLETRDNIEIESHPFHHIIYD